MVLLRPSVTSPMRTGAPAGAVCEPGPMTKKMPSLLANCGSYDVVQPYCLRGQKYPGLPLREKSSVANPGHLPLSRALSREGK
jgi:hypothetical protein